MVECMSVLVNIMLSLMSVIHPSIHSIMHPSQFLISICKLNAMENRAWLYYINLINIFSYTIDIIYQIYLCYTRVNLDKI